MKSLLNKHARWQVDVGGAVLCLLLMAGAYHGLFKPLVHQRSEFDRRRQTAASIRREAAESMGATFDLRKELVRTRGELAQRKVRLRPISQVNRRVADLTSLVDRCGLVTGSVQLGKIGPGPKCAVMPLHLSARGSYQACQEFLHGLVEPFSDFAVAGFEIQGDPQRPGLPARFEIDLYWYAASEQTAMN